MKATRISDYAFGKITVDGRTYTTDLIIAPDKIIDSWWRKQGHSLAIDDLDDIVKAEPDLLIIGTGFFGRMKIPEKTRHYLEQQGIRVHQAKTGDAAAAFNRLQQEYARIVAALHLTC
jgi:hypothetical protein